MEPDKQGTSALVISADGNIVAGKASYLGDESCLPSQTFRAAWWADKESGWIWVRDACGGLFSRVNAISGDGTLLFYEDSQSIGGYLLWLFDRSVGFADRIYTSGDPDGVGIVGGMSSDGRWLAMTAYDGASGPSANLYERPSRQLYVLDEGDNSSAEACADDGTVVGIAYYFDPEYKSRAFRWSIFEGVSLLEPPDVRIVETVATAISSNSRFAAGAFVQPDKTTLAVVIWNENGRPIVLGDVFGDVFTCVSDVSDDGKRLVGAMYPSPGGKDTAFIWDPRSGIRRLDEALALEFGLADAVAGWHLARANAITPDGRKIVGEGLNPEPWTEGWMAALPAYCAPDCNADSTLNINDFICFQSKWREKHLYADYNLDGAWNINDFIAFQADWQAIRAAGGCE